MIKISVFTKDKSRTLLGEFECYHIVVFGKMEISIMMNIDEQLKLIKLLIENYVLFKVQGVTITLIPENDNYQRVNFIFESQSKTIKS